MRQLEIYIYNRDNETCQQCGMWVEFGNKPHHVIPKSRGGDDAAYNLVLLCQRCHSEVHDKGLKLKPEIHEMLEKENDYGTLGR